MYNKFKVLAVLLISFAFCENGLTEAQEFFAYQNTREVFSEPIQVIAAGQQAKEQAPDPIAEIAVSADNPIIAEFGDPTVPHAVNAVETAPKPYRGMISALQAGEDKLAFQYAKQYVDYLQDLKRINSEAVGVMGASMLDAGYLPSDSWAANQAYDSYRLRLENYKNVEHAEEVSSEQDRLKIAIETLINKVTKSENDLFVGSQQHQKDQEKLERLLARNDWSERLPRIAADQTIDIFFFFKPYQDQSIAQAIELEKLNTNLQPESNINLVAFAKDSFNGALIEEFKFKTDASYKIVNGDLLIKELGVNQFPMVAIVDKNTMEMQKITKSVSAIYLDEIIKIIRGMS